MGQHVGQVFLGYIFDPDYEFPWGGDVIDADYNSARWWETQNGYQYDPNSGVTLLKHRADWGKKNLPPFTILYLPNDPIELLDERYGIALAVPDSVIITDVPIRLDPKIFFDHKEGVDILAKFCYKWKLKGEFGRWISG